MSTTTVTPGLVEAIAKLENMARAAVVPHLIHVPVSDGKDAVQASFVALPDHHGKLNLEPLADRLKQAACLAREQRLSRADGPDRREGTARLQTLGSFIAHANRFQAEHSAVWADAEKRRLVSVLDYHPEGADSPARWGKHRGVYECPLSEAWTAWGGEAGLELSQDAFAELLDTRDRELSSGQFPNGAPAPSPASLVNLASNLEVYSEMKAKRERDATTGRVRLSFSEEKGVAGTLQPPAAFFIVIPIFQDSQPQLLEVRLRVTVENGEAKFHLRLHAAGDVLREAFAELCKRVHEATELPVFTGTPE
jgi:hypothetical protein